MTSERLRESAAKLRTLNPVFPGDAPSLLLIVADALEGVAEAHQPKRDDPFSLIQHTFCSCGAMTVQQREDGPVIAPVPYPCPTVELFAPLCDALLGSGVSGD